MAQDRLRMPCSTEDFPIQSLRRQGELSRASSGTFRLWRFLKDFNFRFRMQPTADPGIHLRWVVLWKTHVFKMGTNRHGEASHLRRRTGNGQPFRSLCLTNPKAAAAISSALRCVLIVTIASRFATIIYLCYIIHLYFVRPVVKLLNPSRSVAPIDVFQAIRPRIAQGR